MTPTSGTAPALELREWGIRSRAAHAPRPKSGRCVTSSILLGVPRNADVGVLAAIECVKQWLGIWKNSDEY